MYSSKNFYRFKKRCLKSLFTGIRKMETRTRSKFELHFYIVRQSRICKYVIHINFVWMLLKVIDTLRLLFWEDTRRAIYDTKVEKYAMEQVIFCIFTLIFFTSSSSSLLGLVLSFWRHLLRIMPIHTPNLSRASHWPCKSGVVM